jgi:hypothetical protein
MDLKKECVNNELYRIVKYVHAYIDRFFLPRLGKKEFAADLIITEEEKMFTHTHKRIRIYTDKRKKE